MKAIDILNLCETEVSFSREEGEKLVFSYFEKKFRSIGATIEPFFSYDISPKTFHSVPFRKCAIVSISFSDMKKRRISSLVEKYSLELAGLLTPILLSVNDHRNGTTFDIRIKFFNTGLLPHVFYIMLDFDEDNTCLNIVITPSYDMEGEFESYTKRLTTKDGIQDFYRIIDLMVKAIRLTSIE